MTRRPRRNLRRHITVVLVLLLAFVFSGKLFHIQVVQAAELNEISQNKRAVPFVIPSLRGDIVDRNGKVLATTDERYDVQLSPKNTKVNGGFFYRSAGDTTIGTIKVTSEEAFAEIAEITEQDPQEIAEIVAQSLAENPNSDFAYVKRSVSLEQMNSLKKLAIPWLTFDYHFERSYPNGAVGGNLIGFAGLDEVPQAGVEMSQSECLAGTDGYETYERGADGVALPGSHVVREQSVPGGTVELTIDLDLQWQAQQIVNDHANRLGTEWLMAVLMDAKTGELIAISEDGSVDPGDVSASDPDKREARSFVSPYEPGSTFKALTVATLLEEGIATPDSQYLTPWTFSPEPGVQFSDWYVHGDEPWTLTGILVNSSNVGTAMMGTQLSADKRFEYMKKFGVGQPTHAGMPLEDTGLLYPPEEWDAQTSYNVTFGQGVSSTIIQTAGIYQTIANKGTRIPPSLVKGCLQADGSYVKNEPGESVRVVSENTAATTMRMLETLVDDSWQEMFSIPGYRMAGKTGTGEQSDGQGGYREDYVHSFAGVFPADDPQYVVIASLGFPDVYSTGTPGAVTVVREIAEATIRTMKVPPSSGTLSPYALHY